MSVAFILPNTRTFVGNCTHQLEFLIVRYLKFCSKYFMLIALVKTLIEHISIFMALL